MSSHSRDYEPRGSHSRDDQSTAGQSEDKGLPQRSYPDRTRQSEDPRDAQRGPSPVPSHIRRLEDPRPSREQDPNDDDDGDTRSELPSVIGRLENPSKYKSAHSPRDQDRDDMPSEIGRLQNPKGSSQPSRDEADIPPDEDRVQDPRGPSDNPRSSKGSSKAPRDDDGLDVPQEVDRSQDPRGPSDYPPESKNSSKAPRGDDDVPPEVNRLQDPRGPSEHPPPEVSRLEDSRGLSASPDDSRGGRSSKDEGRRSRGSRSSVTEEICYMEAQTWEGLKSSGKSLLPFLAPDCLMIFPGAAILDHKSSPSLREILTRADMRPWTQYEMDNVHVIRLGSASASISYEVEARRKEERYEAMITSIWRKDPESGDWKMCMHQQTPINVV